MYQDCVIDNSTLVNLTHLIHLGIFSRLKTIFGRLHVPARILKEYQAAIAHYPERQRVVEMILSGRGMFRYCTAYDTIAFENYKLVQGIDEGEAEVVAQRQKMSSQLVFSDDERFSSALITLDKPVRVRNTLHILAYLDFAGFALNKKELLKSLHAAHPFSSLKLRMAYKVVARDLGISISKKDLGRKSSLKALGISNKRVT